MTENILVIGAGLAGITFACKMRGKFNVKVFEKSRGVGGRMSTRKETFLHSIMEHNFLKLKKVISSLFFFRTI